MTYKVKGTLGENKGIRTKKNQFKHPSGGTSVTLLPVRTLFLRVMAQVSNACVHCHMRNGNYGNNEEHTVR